MSETFRWWLALELIGLLSLPLCVALFSRFPDRGYALAKPFGLLLVGYLFWLLNSFHVIRNTQSGIVLVLLLIFAASALVVWPRRDELRAWFAQRLHYVAAVEGLFLLAFVIAAWLRSFVPLTLQVGTGADITGATERPMDFMYVNAISRADYFPPGDAWAAGYHVSYYYFGYLLTAMVGKLAAVGTSQGYNLGLAMTVALATVAAFGIVYNLVASRETPAAGADPPAADPPTAPPSGGRRAATAVRPAPVVAPAAAAVDLAAIRPYVFGFAAALFVVALGNLEGGFEWLAAHGWGPHGMYHFLDINGLAPYTTNHWYPDETAGGWWWRASRILPHGEITEFPNFSFLLGDLHPHVSAIPFVLLAVGLALAFFWSEDPLDGNFWLRRPALLLWSGISLGGLAFLNTWDMPSLTVVALGAALIHNHRGGEPWLEAFRRTFFFAVPLGLAMLVLFIPFYRSFSSQASGFDVVTGHTTRLVHLLIFWGPFGVLLVPFVAVRLWESLRQRPLTVTELLAAAAVPVAVVGVWFVWAAGKGDPVGGRSTGWITDLVLAAFLVAALLALWRGVQDDTEAEDRRTPALFALLLTCVATLLVLGTEFYFIIDVFKSRLNTVFKLYYQAWMLGALASAFAAYYLLRWWRPVTPGWLTTRTAWGGLAALVLVAGLSYPVGAALAHTHGFSGTRSLDALADVKLHAPDEYDAIQWLRQREGSPVIAEGAAQKDYIYPGRISAATGLPAIIEWPFHEVQWRGEGTAATWTARVNDVNTLYTTTDTNQAAQILHKYDVIYVYVGKSERELYPANGLDKFKNMMEVAFQEGGVTIYRPRTTQ